LLPFPSVLAIVEMEDAMGEAQLSGYRRGREGRLLQFLEAHHQRRFNGLLPSCR